LVWVQLERRGGAQGLDEIPEQLNSNVLYCFFKSLYANVAVKMTPPPADLNASPLEGPDAPASTAVAPSLEVRIAWSPKVPLQEMINASCPAGFSPLSLHPASSHQNFCL
jgi:hypothetical protein